MFEEVERAVVVLEMAGTEDAFASALVGIDKERVEFLFAEFALYHLSRSRF